MDFSRIKKITDEEYDGDLDTYENKVKLYKRLDKELKGTDRVSLKILKNDIKELKPIDDYTEYLSDQIVDTPFINIFLCHRKRTQDCSFFNLNIRHHNRIGSNSDIFF